ALSMLSGSAAKGVIALVIVGGAGLGVAALRSSPHAALDARVAHVAPSAGEELDRPLTRPSVRNEPPSAAGAVPEPIDISTNGPRPNGVTDPLPPSEAAPLPARDLAPKTAAHSPGARAAARPRSGIRSPTQGSDENVDAHPVEPTPESAASRL